VRQQQHGYEIDLQHPDGKLTVQANKVVFAIPPRVIAAHIDFVPALPEQVMQDLTATPTWMAGHAKFFALYERPFWRDAGLSGDGISRRGPLMEIHDASAAGSDYGALFGFVGIPANSPARSRRRLLDDATKQLERMFGPALADPLDVMLKDWAEDSATATAADNATISHPHYGMPSSIAALADQGLLFASTEMASQFGGFIEGALEASETALQQLNIKGVSS
jgi:monoamine oxidase